MTVAVRVAVGLVVLYQRGISPFVGQWCRFAPSCSEYARQSITEHGLGPGMWLALKRLARCHPLHPGGYDPPPAREARDER